MVSQNYRFTSVLVACLCVLWLNSILSIAAPPIGTISPTNSITGTFTDDRVSSGGTYALPSGNIVIVSPMWNNNRGAVTCLTPAEYKAGGFSITASNSLTGDSENDEVGYGGVVVLTNGNYVVSSPYWDSETHTDVGAVTWVNGETCIPHGETARGVIVSGNNSLVGSSSSDRISISYINNPGLLALTNGNYVVNSRNWNNIGLAKAGAVTWGNGTTGTAGVVSMINSIVGTSTNDSVGYLTVALTNGNYATASNHWDNGATVDAGMVRWGNGKTGSVGVITTANAYVGTQTSDRVGTSLIALTNGHYVGATDTWDFAGTQDVGAVTWGNGKTGSFGVVSAANSLIGAQAQDRVGSRLIALANGNYVTSATSWDNGGVQHVGAVTWGNGKTGTVGVVSASNSLVGSSADDAVGLIILALSNGHYVVGSPNWNNGVISNAGAATWGNGVTGTVGLVGTANSLVGSSVGANVGKELVALTNGNYVVISPHAGNGAITWGNGTTGTTGTPDATNSLVGSSALDFVNAVVVPLTNGHYVVGARSWNAPGLSDVGAAVWGNGFGGTVGAISTANALIGGSANDSIGQDITPLANGNYLVYSNLWRDGTGPVGAVALGDGNTGTIGEVSVSTALIKTRTNNRYPLPNGDYVIANYVWEITLGNRAGAATLGNGVNGVMGIMGSANSFTGTDFSWRILSGLTNEITPLRDGGYIVNSPFWSSSGTNELGAITYIEGRANLLNNSSFEVAGKTAKNAQSWVGRNLKSADKRVCSKPAKKQPATHGNCIFQFSSAAPAALARSLKQSITPSGWGTAGQSLTLTFDVLTKKLKPGAKVILQVIYTDNTKAKVTAPIPTTAAAYTSVTRTLDLTKTVKKVVVNINIGKTAGRVWLDELWLTVNQAPLLRFPTAGDETRLGAESPAVGIPDGFRDNR